MFEALMQGKLSREQENLEDLLTSMVFGAFRRSADRNAVLRFLMQAVPCGNIRTTPDLFNMFANASVEFSDYEFWPQWQAFDNVSFAEPDLLLTIRDAEKPEVLVAVEAKLWSGKSSSDQGSDAITDQLAKQWAHVCRKAAALGAKPVLIYLTADYVLPGETIAASLDELKRKHDPSRPAIYWLSWRALADCTTNESLCGETDQQCWSDIEALAARLGLTFFKGFKALSDLDRIDWRYSNLGWRLAPLRRLEWRCA